MEEKNDMYQIKKIYHSKRRMILYQIEGNSIYRRRKHSLISFVILLHDQVKISVATAMFIFF